jgi:inner membrane protein involved in colicin E2 resistance
MKSVEERYFVTQYACSVAMLMVSFVTAVKVVISTKSVMVHYRVVYAILGLSLFSWLLLLLAYYVENALMASVCYQYQMLQIL